MAYTEKYFHEFCNPTGQICRISILKKDYSGSSIELEGQPNPITINYDNSDDFKFKAIIPSTAEIMLAFGTGNGVDFSEFWEADEKTFKVEFYIGGNIEWLGYVLVEGFEYNLTGGVYYASITAIDGLSTLESILFKDDNLNKPYGTSNLTYNDGYNFPFILIATEVLRKLDLDIDLWTLIDVYEQNQLDRFSNSRESDPLAITQVSVKTYINESNRKDIAYFEDVNEAWNCKKVMENLLNVWGAKLYQEKGTWRIKRFNVDGKYGIENPVQIEVDTYLFKSNFTYGDPVLATGEEDWVYEDNLDLYSSDSNLVMGSIVENVIGSGIAIAGFYKLKNLGKIIRVSSNEVINIIDYTPPVYNWHKYNTLSGFLGIEEINNTSIIPCNNKDAYLLGNDHLLRMDDVYKQFRVNYEYTYLRDGDSPSNLIVNGNFDAEYTQYGELEAPPNWTRVKWGNDGKYPRLRVDDIPILERSDVNGATDALTMGKQYNNINNGEYKNQKANANSALRQNNIIINNTNDESTFSFFAKYKYRSGSTLYYPTFRIFFGNEDTCGFLINDFSGEKDTKFDLDFNTSLIGRNNDGGIYLKYSDVTQYANNYVYVDGYTPTKPSFFIVTAKQAENYDVVGLTESQITAYESEERWYEFKISVPKFTQTGQISFYIHGLSASSGRYYLDKFYYNANGDIVKKKYTPHNFRDFLITKINMGFVPTEGEEIPSEDYIYANQNINFTDQREPIEIYNGDTEDIVIKSSLIVPDNNTGNKNKWDTSDNDFGKSDLGLILCKTIMSQYGKPSRLLEGSIRSNNISYGTKFYFEAIPNINWVLLRGKFNHKKGYLEDATFAQISSDSIKKGGIINGESLEPNWDLTGNIRCIQEMDVNTGYYEEEEQDINPNSETFGGFRWVTKDIDEAICPIGTPIKYYWGCDDVSYSLSNLTYYTVVNEENNSVVVEYTQDGGEYIYFIHLASLGTVNRVANNYQYNIIDSFQYLSDITINGYLYRVLRQEFVTSAMSGFQQIFDFN